MDIEQLISQYLDGELSSEAEGEFHHKLSVSPEARALFREHLKLQSIARDERLLQRPTTPMRNALFARLQEEEGMAPVGAVPLFDEEEAPSAPPIPAILPTPSRAVPDPSGDRAPVSSDNDHRSEERRRRRRLIPILIPLMLFCIVGGVFLMDGRFFGEGAEERMMVFNDESTAGQQREEPTGLSDRDYTDHADAVIEQPEERNAGSANGRAEEEREAKRQFRYSAPPNSPTPEPEEMMAALTPEELTSRKEDSSPALFAPKSIPMDRSIDKVEQDNRQDLDVTAAITEEVYDTPARDMNAPTFAYGDLGGSEDEPLLADGLQLTLTPETRRNRSTASANDDMEGTTESQSIIGSLQDSISGEPRIAYKDEIPRILDILSENGIQINPDQSFNIRGGRENETSIRTDGIAISDPVSSDSVYIALPIGRAAYQNLIDTLAFSREEFEEMGGIEGIEKARNGAAVTAPPVANSGNIYAQDSSITLAADIGTKVSVEQWQSTTTLPPGKSAEMADDRLIADQNVSATKSSSPETTTERLVSDAPLNVVSGPKRLMLFVGIEGNIAATLANSQSQMLLPSGMTTVAAPANQGPLSAMQLVFGVEPDRGNNHRFFGVIGAMPYTEQKVERMQTTSRVVEQVTDRVVFVDASGINRTTQYITRNRVSTSTSNSNRTTEQQTFEVWGGLGYRFGIEPVYHWKAGVEITGGIGTNYLHAGFSIPISYRVGNALRIEFKPGLHYRTLHTSSEPATTGTLDPAAVSSSLLESLQGPGNEHYLDAGAGIGLILFLR